MSEVTLWELLREVERAGRCSHPVRLGGTTLERATGELHDAILVVSCKDRRAAICPACADRYRGDAWQLVAAGLRGGKGVPATAVEHPRLFVTMTAPSFGPVHAHRVGGSRVRPAPCHPRRSATACPHGVVLDCRERHGADDPVLGEPLCAACFDYVGAVLWNARVSLLWQRTTVAIVRHLAREAGTSEARLRRVVRLSYIKVVEFQRRGLVHLHIVVRADGADGPGSLPPAWLDAGALASAVTDAARTTTVAVPRLEGRAAARAGWGQELDVRDLAVDGGAGPEAIAAYVAKYATKSVDDAGHLARPIRAARAIERLRLGPHHAELVRTAWRLGTVTSLKGLRLRDHAHTLGYGGQATTKSIAYSTTFTALRNARVDFMRAATGPRIEVDHGWRYAGRGYEHPDAGILADRLAEELARLRREGPGDVHQSAPSR
ncbi:MAG: hypothetical protein JWO62_1003 [Acidimicrobiaceae bacterium]|nr:hypothetical protein [Acidimicrobiaceae bacterium]